MISNVIERLYIGIKHRRQCIQIHPELQNLLVLPRALEVGVTNVERVPLGVRGVATVMMSNKD